MEKINLGQISKQIRGVSYKPNDVIDSKNSGYIPLLKGNNIQDFDIDWSNVIYIKENNISENQLLRFGDILLTSSSGSKNLLGKHLMIKSNNINVTFGAFCKVIRPIKNKIYPYYLDAYFKTNTYRKYIQNVTQGANINNLRNEDFDNIEIPLPSYADQIRIANVLGKIEEVIQARKNAIDQLDELVKATFYDMFDDPVRNEKGIPLKELTTKIGSGSTPKGGDESYKDEGISLIRSLNIYNNKFSYDKLAHIDDDQAYKLRNVIVESDDILLNITGASVARCCIVPNDVLPARVNQHVSILRFKKDTINPYYAVHLLTSDSFQKYLYELSTSKSATREAITKDQLENLLVNVPPLDIQNQFAAIAQKIGKLKAEQEKQLLEMQALYASVSHAAFSGTLDLTRIPYDERLLPVVEPVNEPEVIDKKKEEPKELENKIPLQLNGLSGKRTKDVLPSTNEWSKLSFKKIAELITNHFQANYFNSEMLLRFLTEEAKLNVDYFSSKEQKLNLKLENANDFLIFLSDAVTDKNPYLKLEQVFYDAEVENIIGIAFTIQDLEKLSKKTTQERSGIYFRIKNETTTR
ncbi:restriction endonuclease subunit S [Empedobacter tilapiae]|uniref:Restriction endonuclease subunit S n=1 Tax=Empedobacter tilapiae TaxID=2491114 RepID=A0A4Z1B0A2_9FLAO|nr:restriction endonuclease subunit S [Empedobacter tilapiae]TGN26453.1 restriction endonuclease subunit S [Empedobacter tilapiae]